MCMLPEVQAVRALEPIEDATPTPVSNYPMRLSAQDGPCS